MLWVESKVRHHCKLILNLNASCVNSKWWMNKHNIIVIEWILLFTLKSNLSVWPLDPPLCSTCESDSHFHDCILWWTLSGHSPYVAIILFFFSVRHTFPLLNKRPNFTSNASKHNCAPFLWSLVKLQLVVRYLSSWTCKQGAVVNGVGKPFNYVLTHFYVAIAARRKFFFLSNWFVIQLYFKFVSFEKGCRHLTTCLYIFLS